MTQGVRFFDGGLGATSSPRSGASRICDGRRLRGFLASSAGADTSGEIVDDATPGAASLSSSGERKKQTTHVVARREEDGSSARTEKTKWARARGARAVDAEWLARCAERWRMLPEAPYSLFGDGAGVEETEDANGDAEAADGETCVSREASPVASA